MYCNINQKKIRILIKLYNKTHVELVLTKRFNSFFSMPSNNWMKQIMFPLIRIQTHIFFMYICGGKYWKKIWMVNRIIFMITFFFIIIWKLWYELKKSWISYGMTCINSHYFSHLFIYLYICLFICISIRQKQMKQKMNKKLNIFFYRFVFHL